MTTTTDRPDVSTSQSPANRLRDTMAALRLSFTWFGVRKTLTNEQKAQAAASFGATGDSLAASKKLLDGKHPKYKAVTGVRTRIGSYFKGISLPFPEPGIRLIKQDDIDTINRQMTQFKSELDEAVDQLDTQFPTLKHAARDRLGDLYDPADYPDSLRGLFEVAWEYPSVEPPPYLQQLSPELYRQECRRVAARFDEAVQLAEQAFIDELAKLVSHLTERLSGTCAGSDGKPKVFRDSAVENLTEFFDRFSNLNLRSNEQLDQLVHQAQQIVRGVNPQDLRGDQTLRQQVATQLSGVQSVLDGLLVDRPRRNVIRPRK